VNVAVMSDGETTVTPLTAAGASPHAAACPTISTVAPLLNPDPRMAIVAGCPFATDPGLTPVIPTVGQGSIPGSGSGTVPPSNGGSGPHPAAANAKIAPHAAARAAAPPRALRAPFAPVPLRMPKGTTPPAPVDTPRRSG
jgi:hypothetical protein